MNYINIVSKFTSSTMDVLSSINLDLTGASSAEAPSTTDASSALWSKLQTAAVCAFSELKTFKYCFRL